MESIILAPADTVVAFGSQCPPRHRVRAVAFDEALRCISHFEHGCFVLDPRGLRDDKFEALCEAIHTTRMSVLLFTPPSGIARALQVVCPFAFEMVIVGVESAREIITDHLDAKGPSVLSRVRVRLFGAAARSRPDLRAAIGALYSWGPIPNSVSYFADWTSKSKSTVNRWLATDGIKSMDALCAGANVCRMHRWLVNARGQTLEALANRHSSVNAGALAIQFHRFTGLAPGRAARELTSREFAEHVATTLLGR